jgi:hypothetical protein
MVPAILPTVHACVHEALAVCLKCSLEIVIEKACKPLLRRVVFPNRQF